MTTYVYYLSDGALASAWDPLCHRLLSVLLWPSSRLLKPAAEEKASYRQHQKRTPTLVHMIPTADFRPACFADELEEMTTRLHETRAQWTKKMDLLFSACGMCVVILTWTAVSIMDPRTTLLATTSIPPSPRVIFVPTTLLGLGILYLLRKVALDRIDECLLIGFSVVERDDAAILYYRDATVPIVVAPVSWPFDAKRIVWDVLCVQYLLVCAAELLVAALYTDYTHMSSLENIGTVEATRGVTLLGMMGLIVLSVAACALMLRLLYFTRRRIQNALNIKVVCEPYWLVMGLNVEEMQMLCERGV
ncbi:hypothetical protein PM082_000033 [Marasmius tenuissimus]|nr:hypothetical protein PM082_000033 [Marasmius tenuissimus]